MDIHRSGESGRGPAVGMMWATTGLFSLRVAGQAIQRWAPQSWLPPFNAWQGSSTPYPLLITVQCGVLIAMAWTARRAQAGLLVSNRSRFLWAAWLGGLYMLGSIARPLVGLTVERAHPWFSAPISSAFHLVLAAFVLALACYHRSMLQSRRGQRI